MLSPPLPTLAPSPYTNAGFTNAHHFTHITYIMANELSDLERMLLTPDPSVNAIQRPFSLPVAAPAAGQPPAAGGTVVTAQHAEAPAGLWVPPPVTGPDYLKEMADRQREETAKPEWQAWLDVQVGRYPDINRRELEYCIGRELFERTGPGTGIVTKAHDNTPEAVMADYRSIRPAPAHLAAKYAARDAKERAAAQRAASYKEEKESLRSAQAKFAAEWQAYLEACAARRLRISQAKLRMEATVQAARREFAEIESEPPPVQPTKPKG